MLLLIGWRGEPGVKDEPQHITQGKLILPLLDLMEIPYIVISNESLDFEEKNKCDYQTNTNQYPSNCCKKEYF